MRLLVALEDDFRAYRDTIAVGLQILRPDVEVESASLEVLDEELERLDPHLVICSGHEEIESVGTSAWIELSLDPTQPTKIRVGKRHLERTNPALMELVDIVDELV
ncbi:MAG: hypothetical protein M3441_24120 [Chloroflexota bacterium]|jgi:hypothetical protein|nr:hypothetical protein [Chloroflexota bacterium]